MHHQNADLTPDMAGKQAFAVLPAIGEASAQFLRP